jgi:hypothetical protein
MWHDEAALTLNVLGKGFTALLGPLSFAEAAPPLFLWVEKCVTLTFGEGTYALRWVPFLASCAALLLLVPIARRWLPAAAVPWAVLLFAFSDNLLWHACEAKPYAVEVFCAVALLAVYSATQAWPLSRQLLLYTALAPVLIFLAYPGCFLCGGLLVVLLPAVFRARCLLVWLGYGLLTLVIGGAFAVLVLGPVHAQRCDDMTQCWLDHFPPWDRPMKVPVWMAASTCEVGRYCCRPTGQVLSALAAAGAVLLWRRGRRTQAVLLTLPVGLALAASFLRAYPFGGTRVMAYAAPSFVLLTAESAAAALAWLRGKWLPGAVALAGVLLAPAAWTAYRVAVPWERADCSGAAAYVLSHRGPDEEVVANHWEYRYYFRHLGASLKDVQDVVRAPGHDVNRVWLVASGETPAKRRRIACHLPPGGWHTLEEREFARTTVFLLGRPGP